MKFPWTIRDGLNQPAASWVISSPKIRGKKPHGVTTWKCLDSLIELVYKAHRETGKNVRDLSEGIPQADSTQIRHGRLRAQKAFLQREEEAWDTRPHNAVLYSRRGRRGGGWGDGLVGKRAYRSYTGQQFGSQQPRHVAHASLYSSFRGSEILFWALWEDARSQGEERTGRYCQTLTELLSEKVEKLQE